MIDGNNVKCSKTTITLKTCLKKSFFFLMILKAILKTLNLSGIGVRLCGDVEKRRDSDSRGKIPRVFIKKIKNSDLTQTELIREVIFFQTDAGVETEKPFMTRSEEKRNAATVTRTRTKGALTSMQGVREKCKCVRQH